MQAAIAWKRLFTSKHLKDHYYEKVFARPSVGLDRVTNKKFESELNEQIDIILRKVYNRTYSFTHYRMILFLKGPTKLPRQVCVPTVRDKLTLSVLNELLCAVYGVHCQTDMPQKIISDIATNFPRFDSFIKLDVASFYASIEHVTLIRKLRHSIRKLEIIELIRKAIETESLSNPIKEKHKPGKRQCGIPEGLPISNSLANIYLMDLDKKYKNISDIQYFRYVDDILILVNHERLSDVKASIIQDLSLLDLKTNDKNDDGLIATGVEYLGYSLNADRITVRKSSVLKLEQALEELINRIKHEPEAYAEWKINLKISGFIFGEHKYGWMFFYSQITDITLLYHLDNLVAKLLKRHGLDSKIKVKRYVRTYHEITQALHKTSYIPNFDKYTMDEKRMLLSRVYRHKLDGKDDKIIDEYFGKMISKEIRDIEKDIQAFS